MTIYRHIWSNQPNGQATVRVKSALKNIVKPDSDSKRNLMHSNRKIIENEENNVIMNINIKNFLKK